MKHWFTLLAAFASLTLAAAACAETEDAGDGLADRPAEVHVFDAWARSPMDDVGAVYFQAHNSGSQADALIAAECDCAGRVELHETTMVGGEMKMQPVARVELAPDQQRSFEPGGYHVMLFQLIEPLEVGEFISITLEFENADPVTVDAEIRPYVPEEGGMDQESGGDMGEGDEGGMG